MRLLTLLITLNLVFITELPVCSAQNLAEQKPAAATILRLGGQVEVDREALGHPVIAVRLAESTVTDEDLRCLGSLPDLERLDLRATRITDAGLAHLKGCPRLRSLTLISVSRVTDAGLEHLKGLAHLEQLDLQGTGVTSKGLVHLDKLPRLRALKLSGERITDECMTQLKSLKGIEELLLAYTQVTDEGMTQLAGHQALRRLHIRSGRITDIGLGSLEKSAGLELLELPSTPRVTDAALAELQKALPKLQVWSYRSDPPN